MKRSIEEIKEKIEEIFGESDEDDYSLGSPFLKSRKPTYIEVKQVRELIQQIQSLVGREWVSEYEIMTHINNCMIFEPVYFEENNKENN